MRISDYARNGTPVKAKLDLLIKPKAPRTSYLVASGDVPAAWKVWIEL